MAHYAFCLKGMRQKRNTRQHHKRPPHKNREKERERETETEREREEKSDERSFCCSFSPIIFLKEEESRVSRRCQTETLFSSCNFFSPPFGLFQGEIIKNEMRGSSVDANKARKISRAIKDERNIR